MSYDRTASPCNFMISICSASLGKTMRRQAGKLLVAVSCRVRQKMKFLNEFVARIHVSLHVSELCCFSSTKENVK